MTNIIILFCSILGGFLIGRHFEKREVCKGLFFCDLLKYIKLLKANVQSRRLELTKFNDEFCKGSSVVFADYIKGQGELSFANKSQQQLIVSFFSSIKAKNSHELLNNLDYYEQLISLEYNHVSSTFRNHSVCTKLGVLLGVIFGILLF